MRNVSSGESPMSFQCHLQNRQKVFKYSVCNCCPVEKEIEYVDKF